MDAAREITYDSRIVCYACLHKESVYSRLEAQQKALTAIFERLPDSEKTQFERLMNQDSAIGYFVALFRLQVSGIRFLLKKAFRDLWQIGKNHHHLIQVDFGRWSVIQTQILVRDFRSQIEWWVKWACNEPDWDNDDDEEVLTRKNWRAPQFLGSDPERYMPGDDVDAWKLYDEQTTRSLLSTLLRQNFEIPLLRSIDLWHDKAQLLLAKTSTEVAKKASAKKERQGLPRAELKRRGVIFGALEAGFKGMAYCKSLDERQLPLPSSCSECPSNTYAKAYSEQPWQKRIQDEKHRYRIKYDATSQSDRNALIEGATRGTRSTRR
jgi:hypothetical protein